MFVLLRGSESLSAEAKGGIRPARYSAVKRITLSAVAYTDVAPSRDVKGSIAGLLKATPVHLVPVLIGDVSALTE